MSGTYKVISVSAVEGSGFETAVLCVGSDCGEYQIQVDINEDLGKFADYLIIVAKEIKSDIQYAKERDDNE